jgi:hypothetical protein
MKNYPTQHINFFQYIYRFYDKKIQLGNILLISFLVILFLCVGIYFSTRFYDDFLLQSNMANYHESSLNIPRYTLYLITRSSENTKLSITEKAINEWNYFIHSNCVSSLTENFEENFGKNSIFSNAHPLNGLYTTKTKKVVQCSHANMSDTDVQSLVSKLNIFFFPAIVMVKNGKNVSASNAYYFYYNISKDNIVYFLESSII